MFMLSDSFWTLSKRGPSALRFASPPCYQNESELAGFTHLEDSLQKSPHKSTNFHFKFLKQTYFSHKVNFAEKWT